MEHQRFVGDIGRNRRRQTRLADSWLAGDEYEVTLAGHHFRPHGVNLLRLSVAPDARSASSDLREPAR
jgi:hypothetical protein